MKSAGHLRHNAMCFVGSVDDWIDIGHGSLAALVKRYVKHLGQESYFELY